MAPMAIFLQWLLFTAAINHLVLSRRPGDGTRARRAADSAAVRAVAIMTGAALVTAMPVDWLLDHALLRPDDLAHLRPLLFALVALACLVPARLILRRQDAGDMAPRARLLSAANVIVLGTMSGTALGPASLPSVILAGMGTAAGFALALHALDAMTERLGDAHVPAPFRGAPIRLLAAGLFALGLAGFSG